METRRALALGTLLAAVAGSIAACGADDRPTGAQPTGRVVEITMTDMAFSPDAIDVTRGESITFRFANDGQVVHEAVIGDGDYQRRHASAMTGSTTAGMADHERMGHGGAGAEDKVTVAPGETDELTYRFDSTGTVLIGCHQPGHYEAGMEATINVS